MSRHFMALLCVGVVCTLLFLVSLASAVLPQTSEYTILTVKTRYGDVVIERDGWIRFRSNKLKLILPTLYATKEGIFSMKEGDVVVVSIPNLAKGVPPSYYVFLVQENALTDLTFENEKFNSADWTFKIKRNGNELYV